MTAFTIYRGISEPHHVESWPEPPPWRRFSGTPLPGEPEQETRGATFRPRGDLVELVNAAIHLRRPLLLTGKPGTGKSSLAYAIAHELELGKLLVWEINSRSTLQQGLYHYDAIGRLQEASLANQGDPSSKTTAGRGVGRFIRLGALGTALLPVKRPRVLLIDEIDKSDVDLPNDLLHVFEQGRFAIPELERADEQVIKVRPSDRDDEVPITNGRVECCEFPIVVLTSNGEREFPGAFKRRCIRVHMPDPTPEELAEIVKAHLGDAENVTALSDGLIKAFVAKQKDGDMATDQLLNAIRLAMGNADIAEGSPLAKAILRPLSGV